MKPPAPSAPPPAPDEQIPAEAPPAPPAERTPIKLTPRPVPPPAERTPTKLTPRPVPPPAERAPTKLTPRPVPPPAERAPTKLTPRPVPPPAERAPTKLTPRPVPPPAAPKGTPRPAAPKAKPAPPPAMRPAEVWLLTVGPPAVGALCGILLLVAFSMIIMNQPGGFTTLNTALFGPKSAWHLSRGTAFAAYLLMWLSMAWGLLLTNRMARAWPGGPTAADLHEHASLLGLGFAIIHALVLLADTYIGYTLPQLFMPFATAYETFWVGLGQLSFYLLVLVILTFYVRRLIGVRVWRMVHLASYLAFVLALVHGLFSGSDTSEPWALGMYLLTGLSIVALTVYRVLALPLPAPSTGGRA